MFWKSNKQLSASIGSRDTPGAWVSLSLFSFLYTLTAATGETLETVVHYVAISDVEL